MVEKTSDDKTGKSVTTAPGPQEAPQNVLKHCCIVPTLAPILYVPSTSLTSSSYPIDKVPELAIPTDAYLKHINRPCGCNDYLCHLCSFHHTNYGCMLTHIRKHLTNANRCPCCGQGFQNVTSLCKYRKKMYQI